MTLAIYAEIRADLEAQIRRGELAVGERVPTEAELRVTYGVSRATAQRALQELAAAGLVVRYRKRGTFVADGARQLNLIRLITPDAHGPEMPGRHVVHDARVVTAADAYVELPNVDPSAAVVQMKRVKLSPEGDPMALEFSAVPFAVAPQLLSALLEEVAVHDYFASNGIEVVRSRLYVEPSVLDITDADLLGAEAGSPVLRFRRLSWLASGDLAEALQFIPAPGQAEFYLEKTIARGERAGQRSTPTAESPAGGKS